MRCRKIEDEFSRLRWSEVGQQCAKEKGVIRGEGVECDLHK